MQRNKLIKICLSLLIGVILFLVSKSEVKVSIFGEDIRVRSDYQCLECGPYWPACWDEFCDEYNCPFGCLSEDCNGGVCITCSECGIYPHCWSEYCSSSCTYGCSSEGCNGGVCIPTPTPTPTPTPACLGYTRCCGFADGGPTCDCGTSSVRTPCAWRSGKCTVQLIGLCGNAVLPCLENHCYVEGESPPCISSCSSPYCGQGDGCGGSCSNSDASWYDTGNTRCSGCGTTKIEKEQANACVAANRWLATSVDCCSECGPYYNSDWDICTYPEKTSIRIVTYDCDVDSQESRDCVGTIEGYLFNSEGMSVCPADLSDSAYDSLKIGGRMLDITSSSESYLNITTDGSGKYIQSVSVPDTYSAGNFQVGEDFIGTPFLWCNGSERDLTEYGEVEEMSFGFWQDYGGWWQGVGGDVYGGLGLESTIPGRCKTDVGCEPYLVADDSNGQSGLVRYLSGGVELGNNESAAVNSDGWVVSSGYAGQDTNYAYYSSKMALIEKTSWAGSGKPVFNPEVGSDYEIYAYTGTGTIDFDVAVGEKMIFMVGGDVDVTSNVDVAEGGHLAVIASDSITFASDVSQVDGWWVGNSLNIESTGDTTTELQFRGEGSFVGWNGVSLNRDRGESNGTEPPEEFVFRSDLMINAPIALKFSRYVWQEKAPN